MAYTLLQMVDNGSLEIGDHLYSVSREYVEDPGAEEEDGYQEFMIPKLEIVTVEALEREVKLTMTANGEEQRIRKSARLSNGRVIHPNNIGTPTCDAITLEEANALLKAAIEEEMNDCHWLIAKTNRRMKLLEEAYSKVSTRQPSK